MIKHYQNIFGQGRGNCLQACLATVLHLPLESVPHFAIIEGDGEWFKALNHWLNQRGYGAIYTSPMNDAATALLAGSGGYFIMGGRTLSGGAHVVVHHKGKLWHDPMPGGEGLAEVEGAILLFDLCKPTGNLLDVTV